MTRCAPVAHAGASPIIRHTRTRELVPMKRRTRTPTPHRPRPTHRAAELDDESLTDVIDQIKRRTRFSRARATPRAACLPHTVESAHLVRVKLVVERRATVSPSLLLDQRARDEVASPRRPASARKCGLREHAHDGRRELRDVLRARRARRAHRAALLSCRARQSRPRARRARGSRAARALESRCATRTRRRRPRGSSRSRAPRRSR